MISQCANSEPGSTRHRTVVGNVSGDRQLDLGACTVLAPYIETSTDALRSLAHALQSPMTGATRLTCHVRIGADAIVADAQY